ncbi:MAG: glycosyltransferase family 9 protein [Planctomycetota bacterium]
MRILVFRIGQLGDSLIALPALWALKENFPGASMTLLCDVHPGAGFVGAASVYEGTGLFDDIVSYPVEGGFQGAWKTLGLLRFLRQQRFDALAYLAPSLRTQRQTLRDRWFFKTARIRKLIGFRGMPDYGSLQERPLPRLPHEADHLLHRLRSDGLDVPEPGRGRCDVNLTASDQAKVDQWVAIQPTQTQRPWLGIGPGSKMSAKLWPTERYAAVVSELIDDFGVWPVVFGGPEDTAVGEQLIQGWRRGYNAAGSLGLRASVAALGRCQVYLGNDTGTMHMAAASGTRCVAIFSSRDFPGKWDPYGNGHQILRTAIHCEGCMLTSCVEQQNRCLREIRVETVVSRARDVLEQTLSREI